MALIRFAVMGLRRPDVPWAASGAHAGEEIPMDQDRSSRRRWIAYLLVAALALALAGLALLRMPTTQSVRPGQSADEGGGARAEHVAAVVVPAPAPVEAALSGTVYAGSGKPIDGATVCAHCAECNLLFADSPPLCVRSDRDGSYRLQGLTAGEYLVSASAMDYAPKVANEGHPIAFPGQDQRSVTNIDMTLAEGGALVTGVVLDATGGPVAGATVQAITGLVASEGRPTARAVVADEEGRFSLSCLPGHVTLMAVADGYAPGFANRTAPSGGVQVIVTPSSSMSGSVITEQGQPVANIHVTAEAPTDSMREAVSDQAGRFVISGLRHGVFQVRAMGEGWLGDYPATVTLGVADKARDVTIVVHKAVTVRGTLLAEDGSPCDYGRVHIGPRPGDFTMPVLEAPTSLGGAVTLQGVLPGTYQVAVACRGPNFQPAPALQVATTNLSGLVWRAKQELGISGQVLDERGQPVGKFLFQLESVDTSPIVSQGVAAGADGAFSCSGLTPGTYTLQSPHFVEPVSVRLGEQSVTGLKVVAKVLGHIAVRVTTPDGEPLDSLIVSANATDGTLTDLPEEMGNGTYRLGPMTPGSYAVYVSDGVNPRVRAGGPAGATILQGGETVQVQVTYGGYRGRIAGRALDDLGAPLENVWVQAIPKDPDRGLDPELQQFKVVAEARRSLTDAEGRFEIGGLAEQRDLRREGGVAAGWIGQSRGREAGLERRRRPRVARKPIGDRGGRRGQSRRAFEHPAHQHEDRPAAGRAPVRARR